MIPGAVHPFLLAGDSDPLDDLGRIDRSVRLRASAVAYWSRTFGAATSNRVFTVHAWVKRGALSSTMRLLHAYDGSSAASGYINFDAADTLSVNCKGVLQQTTTTGLFRDSCAHLPITVRVNLPAGIQSVYIGDALVASVAVTDAASQLNGAYMHRIGAHHAGSFPFDGLVSFFCFVDGQALTPAAFGQAHPITGQWRPKSKAGIRAAVAAGGGARNGWGANGCFLPFDDTTSLTTLGYDRSQSDTDTTGNNWTATSISLTAGATYDSMLDTPTNNSCTWNPLYPGDSTKTNGNLDAAGTARGTMDAGAIPCQWEITANAASVVGGIVSDAGTASTVAIPNGSTYGFRLSGGTLEYTTNGSSWTSIGTGLTGIRFPYASGGANTLNCGQRPSAYALSSGYRLLCTKNLPFPKIQKSAAAFAVVSDTGANIAATLAAARAGWPAYIDIIKRRDSAEGWRWIFSDDAGNYLDSSSPAAKAAVPSFSGTSYIGYSLKVSAVTGVATGRLVHTNGVADTITDGLSSSRKAVILKNEAAGDWYFYHPDLTSGKLLYLNQITVETTDSTINTVTSTGFTVAAALASGTYRWIALADVDGFLRIGKHVGNSSTDGAFVYNGFTPAFELTKPPLNGTTGWFVFDSKHETGNVETSVQYANTTAGDATGYTRDSVSNGKKWRFSAGDPNTSGATNISVSFAAFPFRYANAR